MKPILERAGTPAVGCSALLGVIIIALYLFCAFCLFMAWWHWRKLSPTYKRHNKLNYSQNQKSGSEPIKPFGESNQPISLLDQPIRLLLHPRRCLLLLLGNHNLQLGKTSRNLQFAQRCGNHIGLRKLPHLLNKLMRFFGHKRSMTPNARTDARVAAKTAERKEKD